MAEQEKQDEYVAEDVQLDTKQVMQIVTTEPKLVRKFEIQLYNEDIDDNTGATKLVYVPSEKPIIVSAADKNELQNALKIYVNCGQVPKIVREVDPPNKQQLEEFAIKHKAYNDYKLKKIDMYEAYQLMSEKQIDNLQNIQKQDSSVEQNMQQTFLHSSMQNTNKPKISAEIKKTQPRYYKVGDIELKEDNGIMYQKQFIVLTDIEASNIRIVDNKTNRVMNLNRKHIEMKKWIMVENQNQNEQDTLEENLK